MNTPRRVTREARGFTLVEMLVVITLIGMMAATATTAASESGDFRLNLIQTEVCDALEYAKALSRSTREAYGVVFEASSERLAIVDESGNLVVDPLTKGDYIIDFTQPQYPPGINIVSASFGDAGSALVVDPDGVAMAGGSIVLSFAGVSRTLTIDLATASLSAS